MPDASQFATYARVLRLTPVEDTHVALPPPPSETELKRASGWRGRGLVSFLVLLVLPTLVAATYYAFLAADRYQSEVTFVLRTPGQTLTNAALSGTLEKSGLRQSSGGLTGGGISGGAALAIEDSFVVQEFLVTRDALAWVVRDAGLRAAYDAPAARRDILWRFPNPFEPTNEEGLFWHFQRMVTADIDNERGLNTLAVQAFTPAEAQRIAESLLQAAEKLVNRLNARARQDAMEFAESEVERHRERATAAQAALTAFRERERLVDPRQATLPILETIGKLSEEAALVSVQIGELSKSSSGSPQLAPLRLRRGALEAQIALERQRLAGDAQSVAPRIVEYERLMLEHDFANKALLSAMTAVETARMDALRQQVYLERVTSPSKPDYPAHPWRVVWTLAVAAIGFMLWRIWRILSADALRHTDT